MSYPQSPELNEIAKLLDLSRPPLLVVVGAGVSIGATGLPHASWLGLLKHGIRHLTQKQLQQQRGNELEASLDASFSPFNLRNALQHAELVEQLLTTPDATAIADWLKSAFSSFKAPDDRRATLKALRDLQQAGALLLTTNYDNLISDITDVPPVTWEEHSDFHRVMTRQQPGVLHIHGHWQRPSSVVLGRTSYDRVVADEDLQQLFKTLWLDWSWLYVGCGDGLDDPNLGRLLEWGKRWGESAMPDYLLAQEDKAAEIDQRSDKPKNIVSIGYPSHADLPELLHSVIPSARSWPFVQIDEEFPLFRVPGSNIPFPTRQEYLDDDVPALAADAEVKQRLQTHGWACIMDLASVGKTTLALRLATSHEQRELPVFYFDLKDEIFEDDLVSPTAALNRLRRPGTLLILDNIHHQPKLARKLWQQWKDNPCDSHLLLVATRMQHHIVLTPQHDLTFFEQHSTNAAIVLQPSPEDLGRVAKHINQRVGGTSSPPMPEPPPEVLAAWHRDFRAALNAFTFAIMRRLADFQKGKWELPPSAASGWVREKWLKKVDPSELENAICLAAFSAQALEMLVQDEALPHPGKMEKLRSELCLVVQMERGQFRQYRQFSLREPGWGRLILAALEPPRDREQILFDTAVRHPMIVVVMSRRLKGEGLNDERERLWAAVASNKEILAAKLFDVPLSYLGNLLRESRASNQAKLTAFLWHTIESQTDKLAASARATLGSVGSFLEIAKQQGRNIEPLWKVLESQPEKFAARAWETSLEKVAHFMEAAKNQGRDTSLLWEAIESQAHKLVARLWQTPLEGVSSFLNVAKRHERDTEGLWVAIESQPDKLAARAWQTSLEHVTGFIDVAKSHERDTEGLWVAIESQADKLADCMWDTTLDGIASFVNEARKQGRDTNLLWQVLEKEPDHLSRKAKTAASKELVGFAHYAPISLLEIALREIKPGHWNAMSLSEGMVGAAWLAGNCDKANRNDLSSDLIALLVRRANWRDFPPHRGGGGFVQVCWLLANLHCSPAELVDRFVEKVCTDKWFEIAYAVKNTACGNLASGLRQLALNQSVERCRRFHHRGLKARLIQELARFQTAKPSDQSQIMQLLGSAVLCGWAINSTTLADASPATISSLGVDILPHRPNVTRVEDSQFQLWLGLRAFVSITEQRLPMSHNAIALTLKLWGENLAETSISPTSVAHRVNESMVEWLENCLGADPVSLLPSGEPLWALVGFPAP